MSIGSIPGNDRFKLESEVVDSSFLALVRLGVRAARNYFIRETLPVVDSVLKKDTPLGTGYYRYRFDGYGESTKGRLWPLLTSERIQYELQYLKESQEPNPSAVLETKLTGLEAFASRYGIFAEQVWDEGEQVGRQTVRGASDVVPCRVCSAGPLSQGRSHLCRSPTVRDRYGN